MPVETAADRASMFALSEFAIAIVYTTSLQSYSFAPDGVTPLNAMFENAYTNLFNNYDNIGISSNMPRIVVPSDYLPAEAKGDSGLSGDTVLVSGVSYYVRDINNDMTGITILQLEKV